MSLKQSTFHEVENSTPMGGLEPMIFRIHTEFSIISRPVSDHQSNASQNIFLYIRGPKRRNCIRNDKIWIRDVRWRPFWILRFVGKWCHLQQKFTAEMHSAQKIHIETTNKVLFLKNAYRALSKVVFQLFALTMKKKCHFDYISSLVRREFAILTTISRQLDQLRAIFRKAFQECVGWTNRANVWLTTGSDI